jgi:hypothetical protein
MPQPFDRVMSQDLFELEDIFLALRQRVICMTMKFLAWQCRRPLGSRQCNFRSNLTQCSKVTDQNHQATTQSQSRFEELHGSTSSAVAGWADIDRSGTAAL